MISSNDLDRITGATVYGRDGDKIGSASNVYLDDASGRPEWVTVNTGLFGTSESFIPLSEATLNGDRIEVPFDKKKVKDAPRLGDHGHLEPAEEDELYRYYGMSAGTTGVAAGGLGTADSSDTARTGPNDTAGLGTTDDRARGTVGHDTSGPTTDDAMTLSEEHLEVGKQSRETGRARLRKYVTTETETVNVPVTREEVRLEREPITDGNAGAAHDGPAISEEEHEVTLHEERPVVTTEAVPVERVRMEKETVTDTETVSGEVRKENIDLDDTDTARGNRTDSDRR